MAGSSRTGKARRRSSRWSRRAWPPTASCAAGRSRAHTRSGDRIAIAAYLGNSNSFDRATLEFSKAYAEQNDLDYQALPGAVKSGRITAQTGL
jgi:hypothetical protein